LLLRVKQRSVLVARTQRQAGRHNLVRHRSCSPNVLGEKLAIVGPEDVRRDRAIGMDGVWAGGEEFSDDVADIEVRTVSGGF
jgi:hypothetical protein